MTKLQKIYPYLFFLPIAPFFLGVLFYPWIISLFYSVHEYKPTISQGITFVGLNNYVNLILNPEFHRSLFVTFYFAIGAVTLELILGLGVALLVDREFRLNRIVTTLILVPMVVAPASAALSMRQFIHPILGLFNFMLAWLGLPPQDWMGNPDLAIPVAILMDVWQNTSFVTLIILAGLHALPVEHVEAAQIDGAGSWQLFRYIKLPFLRPLILIAILFRTMFALRVFETILLVFSETGGPANAAQVLGIFLYWIGFRAWDFGLAAAMSWIMLLITISITIVLVFSLYKEVEL